MNILIIYQYFLGDNESGHTRWNEMVKMWGNSGHKVTVVAGMVNYATGLKQEKYKGKHFCLEQYSLNVDVMRCHVSEAYNKSFRGRLWGYFSFTFSGSWAAIFKLRRKYDLVVVSSPPLFVGITGLLTSKIKRIPMVFEVRDLWPESAIETGVLKNRTLIKLAYWVERLIYKNSGIINVLTPAFYNKLLNEKKITENKLLMIPNAADFSMAKNLNDFDSNSLRQVMGWTNKFVVLYVGAHGIANKLIQLIETAELLRDTNAHLVLIGDGMEKEQLMEEAKNRNLSNVQFIDSVPKQKVFEYIMASDAGTSVLKKVDVFKTIYSNKTFDYMSCKKPILMAIDGVSRQLVEKAKAGVFVEPENPVDFAEKIRYFIANPSAGSEMGENGYNYAKANFDRAVLSEKYLEKLKVIVKD